MSAPRLQQPAARQGPGRLNGRLAGRALRALTKVMLAPGFVSWTPRPDAEITTVRPAVVTFSAPSVSWWYALAHCKVDDTALREGYRFLSFGDAMLIERRT